MNVLVVGAGAIGLYYGSRLQRLGHRVQYLARGNAAALRSRGLSVRSLNQALGCPNDSWTLDSMDVTADWREARPAELVLLATKSTANAAIREETAKLVSAGGRLLVMQNGLGEEEQYERYLPRDQILGGICFIGATLVEPTVLTYSGKAALSICDVAADRPNDTPSPAAQTLAKEFERVGVPTSAESDHQLVRWKKLVWNIPFNGLCIVLKTNSGALLRDPNGMAMLRELMAEVLAGAAACRRRIDQGYIDEMIKNSWPLGDYEPSMVHDFQAGRPIEIEAIYETPLRMAAEKGFEMKRVKLLYRQLNYCLATGRASANAERLA